MLLCWVAAMAQSETDSHQVFFRVGSSRLNVSDIPQALVDSAKAVCMRGEKFTVLGVASPEGGCQLNERLALRRAKMVVKHLVSLTDIPDSMFVLQAKIADASMLRSLVSQDSLLPDRQQVLEILDSVAPIQQTLARLKRLSGGTPYLYIKEHIFPYLRASVGSDAEMPDYHPDLASRNQPEPIRRIAVAQYSEPRHSSYKMGNSSAKDGAKLVAKPDSVKPNSARKSRQATPTVVTPKKIEQEKSSDYGLLFWVIVIVLLLALWALYRYHRKKVSELEGELAQLRQQLANVKGQQTKAVEDAVRNAEKSAKEQLYNDGELLYKQLLEGRNTHEWTNNQIRSLVSFYAIQHHDFVQGLQTDYENLPLNHILFMILLDMGKTDQEIQQMMGVSQTTIRSYRFRIKGRKINKVEKIDFSENP